MRIPILSFLLILFITTSHSQSIKVEGLNSYMQNKLSKVENIESSNDTLSIYGYNSNDKSTMKLRIIKLERGEVYAINSWSHLFQLGHWRPMPISLTTIPFKIRPKVKNLETSANSGIKNLGLNFDIFHFEMDRYFWNGKKSNHKIFAGIWLAPSVEELNATTTENFLNEDEKSKQLFFNAALTLNYSYNDITFTFVPAGFDFATSSVGEEWIYGGKRWWGFGIGLEPKFLNVLK
ncbi:MAG: hypothetical protein ABGW97_09765 [Christiangramia sp.]|uniref:hypothetical protein n=1 Tax=Christiangramia sp. TaxID=1931228 RepID=UPI0032428A5D